MNAIGLDIGTTTLSAVVADMEGRVLEAVTLESGADIPGGERWARLQDPEAIFEKARAMVDGLMARHAPVGAIGLDGQMHGMLYVDGAGRAVSPLATWQDARGDLPYGGGTYASELTRRTGCPMATGFGLTTHFWNVENGRVPEGAARVATIADYVAMRLCDRTEPVIHATNAASMGLFDLPSRDWDDLAVANAGIDRRILPEVEAGVRALGGYRGAAVSVALGDNQASFIGSVREMERTALVNMGTGGQISMMSDAAGVLTEAERRPLLFGQYLLVGSSLCGGHAYAILEKFVRSCARLAGCEVNNLYPAMNEAGLAALALPDNPVVSPRFSGTRKNPALRGEITGLSTENFDAARLIGGTLQGMAAELFDIYREMLRAGATMPEKLVGSGNGIRKNPALRRAFELAFGMPLLVPAHDEEAAFGAALYGMAAAGLVPNIAAAQALIRYQE
jgi:sedoheptulokinase